MGLEQEGIKVLLLDIIQFFLSTEEKKNTQIIKTAGQRYGKVVCTASNLAASACVIKSL